MAANNVVNDYFVVRRLLLPTIKLVKTKVKLDFS